MIKIMACRDVWNTWSSGLWSPQNPTAKPEGFCGDRRPEGHEFHTTRLAMIKTYHSTSIIQNYDKKA